MCPVMLPQVSKYRVLRFGAFEADLQARELRKQGMQIKLQEHVSDSGISVGTSWRDRHPAATPAKALAGGHFCGLSFSAIWEAVILTELASLSVSLFRQRQPLWRGDIRGNQSRQPFDSLLYWRWRSEHDQAFPKDTVPGIRAVRQA